MTDPDSPLIQHLLETHVVPHIRAVGAFVTGTGKSTYEQKIDTRVELKLDEFDCYTHAAANYLFCQSARRLRIGVYEATDWDELEGCGHHVELTLIGFDTVDIGVVEVLMTAAENTRLRLFDPVPPGRLP